MDAKTARELSTEAIKKAQKELYSRCKRKIESCINGTEFSFFCAEVSLYTNESRSTFIHNETVKQLKKEGFKVKYYDGSSDRNKSQIRIYW